MRPIWTIILISAISLSSAAPAIGEDGKGDRKGSWFFCCDQLGNFHIEQYEGRLHSFAGYLSADGKAYFKAEHCFRAVPEAAEVVYEDCLLLLAWRGKKGPPQGSMYGEDR